MPEELIIDYRDDIRINRETFPIKNLHAYWGLRYGIYTCANAVRKKELPINQNAVRNGGKTVLFHTMMGMDDESAMLYNLCNNAIKFTQQGWVRIEISYIHEQIIFSVLDSGIGLDDQEQRKIFEAFTQADTSTTRLYGGTGLGLSISKNLARLLGGDLSVRSEKGKGSCFTLNIELGSDTGIRFMGEADTFQQLVSEYKHAAQARTLPKLRGEVLVAEDNAENQKLICHLLAQCGLQVTLVSKTLIWCCWIYKCRSWVARTRHSLFMANNLICLLLPSLPMS